MAGERDERLFLVDVEDLARLVAAGAGEPLAVGAEGHVEDPVGVVLDLDEELAGRDLPDPDGAVGAGGGDSLLSGLKATAKTLSLVSTRSRTGLPPPPGSAIQSVATPKCPGSPLAVASHLPSGLKAMS